MLRETRPCAGIDAGSDIHCADRACVGRRAHVTSSRAPYARLLLRSCRPRTLRVLLSKPRHTRQEWCPPVVSKSNKWMAGDVQDSNLVASPFGQGLRPSAIRGPACSIPSRLEQFDRIAVGIFNLNLFAARADLHLISKTLARIFQLSDARWQVLHLKENAVPSAGL